MKIFPAIDLYGGKAVRLYKGDYDQMTVYDPVPLNTARAFAACGARYLHTVDLEGARFGTMPHLELIRSFVQETELFVEVGGGIRTMEAVETYISAGVGRVILGTAAVTDEKLVSDAVQKYGAKIAVGADIRDGFVAIKGWTEKSALTCEGFFEKMQRAGVSTVICTDISRDGAMRGTNRALYRQLSAAFHVDIIASGGVSTLDDVRALAEMGLYGAIIGKAYYTGDIDLAAAIEAAR